MKPFHSLALRHRERPKTPAVTAFLHIPKTAGTSITAAVGKYFPQQNCILGDISSDVLKQRSVSSTNRIFIAGHWMPDTLTALSRNAVRFTVLRDPRDQTISNYLHVCREASDLGTMAREMGFKQFVTEVVPYFLVFQSGSLLVPQICKAWLTASDVENHIHAVIDIMEQLDYVGCLEEKDDLALCLPLILGLREPLTIPWLNRAGDGGICKETVVELRRAYDELSDEPESGRLIRIERRTYERAVALTRQREGMLREAEKVIFSPDPGATRAPYSLDFRAADAAIQTETGEKSNGAIRLSAQRGCGIYGPYVDLPIGRLTALISLVGPHRGRVTMDIAADRGETVLASRAIDLAMLNDDFVEISTILTRPFAQCEVRLFCDGEVDACVVGVHIRAALP
jgi:Sulfotransferase family